MNKLKEQVKEIKAAIDKYWNSQEGNEPEKSYTYNELTEPYMGCVCAGKMQQDITKAHLRERLFKQRQSRMQRFIKTYIQYFTENPTMPMRINVPNSENRIAKILIYRHLNGYLYCYDGKHSKIYGTLEEVLSAVFDIIEPIRFI